MYQNLGTIDCPHLSWVNITNNENLEQNQAYPVGALYMDIDLAEFQNPTMSPFWENPNWIYVVILVNRDLRFSIFGQNTVFWHHEVVSESSAEKRTCSSWSQSSFDTNFRKFGWEMRPQEHLKDVRPRRFLADLGLTNPLLPSKWAQGPKSHYNKLLALVCATFWPNLVVISGPMWSQWPSKGWKFIEVTRFSTFFIHFHHLGGILGPKLIDTVVLL